MKINVLQLLGKKKEAPAGGKIAPGFDHILRKESAREEDKGTAKTKASPLPQLQQRKPSPEAVESSGKTVPGREWASDETIFVHRLIHKSVPEHGGPQIERIVAHELLDQDVQAVADQAPAFESELVDLGAKAPKQLKTKQASPELTEPKDVTVPKHGPKAEAPALTELAHPSGAPEDEASQPQSEHQPPEQQLDGIQNAQDEHRRARPQLNDLLTAQSKHQLPPVQRGGPHNNAQAKRDEQLPAPKLPGGILKAEPVSKGPPAVAHSVPELPVRTEESPKPLLQAEKQAVPRVPATPVTSSVRKPRISVMLDEVSPQAPATPQLAVNNADPKVSVDPKLPEARTHVEHAAPAPLRAMREDTHVPIAPFPQEVPQKDELAPPEDKKQARPLLPRAEETLLFSRTVVPHVRPLEVFDTKRSEHKTETATINTAASSVVVEQVVARAQSHQVTSRVTAPIEKDEKKTSRLESTKELSRETHKTDDALPLNVPTHQATPALSAEQPFRVESPTVLKDAAPLAPLASVIIDDPTLRAVLLPTIARMSMDTGDNGQLNVQVKVHEGLTDVRATGPGAQLLEARQGELRVALAREGLALGHFDLTQSGSQQRHFERPEPDMKMPPPTRRAASPSETATEDGRIHVKA